MILQTLFSVYTTLIIISALVLSHPTIQKWSVQLDLGASRATVATGPGYNKSIKSMGGGIESAPCELHFSLLRKSHATR